MTQRFGEGGRVIPVTIVQAGPCQITQVLDEKSNGYQAVQIGFGEKKKLGKPLAGHLKDLPHYRFLREFRIDDSAKYKRGDTVKVDIFNAGDSVKVTGISKGKGFQGVVKRHGFKGGPASHGHKDNLRAPGSIGATEPARVFKGTRMAGRMGGKQTSTRNLEIIGIEADKNLLLVKGSVPGARNGLVMIQTIEKSK